MFKHFVLHSSRFTKTNYMIEASNPEQDQEQKEPTPEEIAAYRAEMEKFYDDQLPLIRKQREYEMALADIEEARTRVAIAIMRKAQVMAGPPVDPSKKTPDPAPDPSERKLKK